MAATYDPFHLSRVPNPNPNPSPPQSLSRFSIRAPSCSFQTEEAQKDSSEAQKARKEMDDAMSGFYIKTGNGSVRGAGAKCGRWNPTTEQVKVLTDLFRSGLRTPSTDQIQKISNQLSFYGKIESKNVFYWFQNHKARERQKRRRVSVEEKDVVRRQDKYSSAKLTADFSEVSPGLEPERVIETLQLFPVNSFEESEPEKLRLRVLSPYNIGDAMDHPPLDLRLSFF